MTEEQIKEVMRLADDIADYAWKQGLSDGAYSQSDHDRKSCDASRAALEAHLRTIGTEPENTFPLNPNGASKWAHLQKHDGAEAIGVVFRTGSGSVGSLVDGRVVWADWLAHPNGSKPESVNAELLEALKECMKWQAEGEFGDPLSEKYWSPAYKEFMGKTKEAIARAESASETPAKVSPCAGHAVQQEADESCAHRFVRDEEAPRHLCCQACGEVKNEADEARSCETCGGRGEVGGFVGGGAPGYETHPCPDCRSGKASLGGLQFKCWRCLDTGFIPKAASLPEPPDVKCPNGCKPKKGGA